MKQFRIIFVTILVLGGCNFLAPNKGAVQIINKSSEKIISGQISICQQQFFLSEISPNESKIFAYKVRSDSHYAVSVKFKSGRTLNKEIGYVTNGMNVEDDLIVSDSDIVLKNKSQELQ